jgi:N-acetylglucosaminyldiphosphoundecaprenol N-acetyl-beta-D-mannosaminyltransferase
MISTGFFRWRIFMPTNRTEKGIVDFFKNFRHRVLVEFKFLGVRIDSFSSEDLARIFAEKLNGSKFCHIATVNPEFLVTAKTDNEFKKILNHTELNVCDGVGIQILSRLLYGKNIERITGVQVADIVCKICEQEKKSIFFLGGRNVAEKASAQMKKIYPKLRIVGYAEGTPRELLKEVKDTNPDAILVAYGAPAQEKWIATFAKEIPSLRIGIGIGGTFDFWAGKVKRAPNFARKIGIEWLWRLIQEPKTRAKRIWNAVFVFSKLALQERFYDKDE